MVGAGGPRGSPGEARELPSGFAGHPKRTPGAPKGVQGAAFRPQRAANEPKVIAIYCVCSTPPSKVDGIYHTSSTWERSFSHLGRPGCPEAEQREPRMVQGELQSARREPRGSLEGLRGEGQEAQGGSLGTPWESIGFPFSAFGDLVGRLGNIFGSSCELLASFG